METSAQGSVDWSLVVAIISVIIASTIAFLSYRHGVKQGQKQEQSQRAEDERKDREEDRSWIRRAEKAVEKFEALDGALGPQIGRMDTQVHSITTTLTNLEQEISKVRQELEVVQTVESLQFLLFSRRWRQAAVKACRTTEGSQARTEEIAKIRDELTDRCGAALGIAAYQLPEKLAGLITGKSFEHFQVAYQHRTSTQQHLEGIDFPVAVALYCIEQAEAKLCDWIDERQHPDLKASLERCYFDAVMDYIKVLEQESQGVTLSNPTNPIPTTS